MSASPFPRWSAAGPTSSPTSAFVVTDDDTLTYGELERRQRRRRVPLRRLRRRQGHPRRRARCRTAPRGRWWRSARQPGRRHPRAAEHLPPPARARGAAARPRASSISCSCGEFLGRDYLADLTAISPEPRGRAAACWSTRCRACASVTVWDDDRSRCGRRAVRPGAGRRARRVGAARRRPRHHVHLRQPRHAQGCDPHPRRRARLPPRPASRSAASRADDRLYIPMPFFWVGGFGTGLLSTLLAGATLLTEARPGARAHACRSSNASGSRCSGAGPSRRPRSPATPASRPPTSRRSARGASTPSCPPEHAGRARVRGRACSA